MATRHPHTGRPKSIYSLLEARALLEAAALPWALPLLAAAPQGDGHPVLLLPGFMGSELSLIGLELFLRSRGYAVETWGLGRNVGFHARHATALEQKIRHVHHQTGRKLSLVGWSLGGVFALYGAHQVSECVRSVITLGSPITVDPEGSASPPLVKAMYRLIAHPMGPAAHTMQPRAKKMRERDTLTMPLSCLYSVGDGVVPPQEATVAGNPALHENIRVPGSHVGLGFNAVVLWIVADRLAQPEGAWRRFEAQGPLGAAYRMLTHERLPV
jgi:pimeloyl-ACP methyl ester carboxylesterase